MQRGRTCQALAMAEANEPFECAGTTIDAASSRESADPVADGLKARTPSRAPGPDLLSKVGQERIANLGCPPCGFDGVHLELAANDRGLPRRVDPGGLGHGSGRNGAVSTYFAIRKR